MKNSIEIIHLFCLVLLMVILSSCAPYELSDVTGEGNLFSGIWHGLILPFAVIGKLFGIRIGLYNINSEGFAYYLGLFISLMMYFKLMFSLGKREGFNDALEQLSKR